MRTAALLPEDAAGRVAFLQRIARARWALPLLGATLGTAAAAVAMNVLAPPPVAAAASGADSTLFVLTNADRASNGVPSLVYSQTLQTIGEGGYYGGCGFAVHGRSVDMIQRNYFAHPILGCGKYVFSIMQTYGVPYRSAGENIGWVSGESGGNAAASYINGAFMNSPEHRDNILDRSYTEMGAGSAVTAGGVRWTGAGSPGYTDVWMFSEEFAQVGGVRRPSPPPRPTAPPTPAPTHRPARRTATPTPAPRNSPAPPAPSQPPARVTPVPTPAATPTPSPVPAAELPTLAPPPLPYRYQGVLPGTIESVLEAYLDD